MIDFNGNGQNFDPVDIAVSSLIFNESRKPSRGQRGGGRPPGDWEILLALICFMVALGLILWWLGGNQ